MKEENNNKEYLSYQKAAFGMAGFASVFLITMVSKNEIDRTLLIAAILFSASLPFLVVLGFRSSTLDESLHEYMFLILCLSLGSLCFLAGFLLIAWYISPYSVLALLTSTLIVSLKSKSVERKKALKNKINSVKLH